MAALEQMTTKQHEQGFDTEELQSQRKNTKKPTPRGNSGASKQLEKERKKPFEKTRNLVSSSGIYFRGDLEIINAS